MGITAGLTRSLLKATPLEQSASVDWTPNLQGITFNGTNEYANVGSSTSIQDFDDFSMSFWFKADTLADFNMLYSDATTGYKGKEVRLRYGKLQFWTYNMGTDESAISTTTIVANTWYHAVVTHSSAGKNEIFINGALEHDDTTAGSYVKSETNGYIGRYDISGTDGGYWDGEIDEVAIFPRVLLASDISDIYNEGRPEDLTKYNPVGWWRMGDTKDGSGATVSDLGYGKNDATLVNIPLHSLDTASSYSNYSIDFNGTDEYVDCGTNGALASENITISAWVKPEDKDSPALQGIVTNNNTSAGLRYLSVNANRFEFTQMNASAVSDTIASSTAECVEGVWQHVVATSATSGSDTVQKIYVNGILSASETLSGKVQDDITDTTYIGYLNVTRYFNGMIDSVAVWDSALTSAQVNDLYNGGLPSSITGAEHWWRMGEDESGTGGVVADALGVASDALYLPGVASNYASVPDAADLDGFTNFTFEAKGVTFADWTPSATQGLMSKYKTSGNERSWQFELRSDGKLEVVLSFDGVSSTTYTSSAPLTDHYVNDGDTVDLMAMRTGEDVRFYVNGVKLGDDVTCVTTALHNSTDVVAIGAAYNTIGDPMDGSMQRARVWNSAVANQENPTETPVLDMDFTRATHGSTSFACTSGQTVTINSTAIDNPAMIREVSDGVLVNTPTSSRSVPAEDASYNHRSISFNGSDESMTTGADDTLASKSYSFWANSTFTTKQGVFDHGGAGLDGAFYFNYSTNRPLLFLGGTWQYWVDNSAQDDGNWHHHVVVLDSATLTNSKWYLDGVLQTISYTHEAGSASAYTTGIRIGRAGSYYFDGSLSDFAIFEGELSAATVTAIYNNGVPADLSKYSPTNWWRMGEGDDTGGTVITDSAGADNGTLVNVPTWTNDTP